MYNCKVHHNQGGDVLEVEDGGEIRINTGGSITAAGTQAAAIADVDTGDESSSDAATAQANAAAINSILAALRGVGIIASE